LGECKAKVLRTRASEFKIEAGAVCNKSALDVVSGVDIERYIHMGIKGFVVRALPFIGTFALGMFIASFFVDIGRPFARGGSWKHHKFRQLKIENERLRNENLRLRNELESVMGRTKAITLEHETLDLSELEGLVPPPPPAPAAPLPPKHIHK
jgi:hypothetical protein